MKYKINDIEIPKWISTRTYLFGTELSKTFIFNEKSHQYIQLDGITSDFWFIILEKDAAKYESFISKYNLEDDADTFIKELSLQGLLILKKSNNDVERTDVQESFNDVDNDESIRFVEEMNEWLRNNNFMSSVFLELTYRCNLKCVHCYNPKDNPQEEIPFDKAKQIIDDAYELGCFNVTLSGGEATTYSKFIELVDYIRDKRMSLTIFTNGQILAEDESLYSSLLKSYPHMIGVSIYSDKESNHDKVTSVEGSFDKSLDLIKKLRKDGVLVQIKNFLLNFVCDDCKNVCKIGKEINAIVTPDISLIPTIEGDKKTFEFALTEDDYYKLFADLESPLYIGNNKYDYDLDKFMNDSPCFGGHNGLCIAPNLDVNICVSMPMPVGNLNADSLIDIWKEAKAGNENSKLYQWRQITNASLPDCYKEDYCKFCHYCAGMGLLENGYLKKSDVLCTQAKAKQRAYNDIKGKN